MQTTSIFWFRRDLRLDDNIGLSEALKSDEKVIPIFIFDRDILDHLEDQYDRRVDYIHQALEKINQELKEFGSSLLTFHGKPLDVFKQLEKDFALILLPLYLHFSSRIYSKKYCPDHPQYRYTMLSFQNVLY